MPKGPREIPETAEAARRFIRALGRKIGDADPEDLAELVSLEHELNEAFRAAVDGLRINWQRSDMEIARVLGVTRQAVSQRWPRQQELSPCDHHVSLYGRCAACGMTWAEQAKARGN